MSRTTLTICLADTDTAFLAPMSQLYQTAPESQQSIPAGFSPDSEPVFRRHLRVRAATRFRQRIARPMLPAGERDRLAGFRWRSLLDSHPGWKAGNAGG